MGTTRSTAAGRAQLGTRYSHPGESGDRRLETILLSAVSGVVILGLFLVYQAKSVVLAQPVREGAASQPLNLNQLRAPEDLLLYLGIFPNPVDRTFAARRIHEFARAHEIRSVNELRTIHVSASQIDRTRGLDEFAARLKNLRAQSGKSPALTLPLLTPGQVQQLRASFWARTPWQFRLSFVLYGLIFFAAFYAVHIAWRALAFRGDEVLLPLIHFLSGIGLWLMISLRDPLRERALFPDFVLGTAIGCGLLFLCSRPDYERLALRKLAYVSLLASLVLSVLLLTLGSGPGASDAKVNLTIGPLSTQPVEAIKILLIFFLASYLAARWEFFRELKEPQSRLPRILRGLEMPRLQYAVPVVVGVAVAISFFFLQKDLGPALVFAAVFLALYGIARGRAPAILIGCAALIAAFGAGYWLGIPRTVAARVGMWLSPWDNNIRSGGDHLAQSLWTFASGGVFGTGLGLGQPESVPAIHTDLILAAAGEELGFVGLLGIYCLYGLLIRRALKISFSGKGHYTFFLGMGVTLLIGFQVAMISGGILGLVPLSGVITPFLNYGKSSAIANFVALGILAAISGHPGASENEPFRKQVRWATGVLAGLAALIVIQAARIQVFRADQTLIAGALVTQADGHRRFSYNPRVLEAASQIVRGSIFDRSGVLLASSSFEKLLERSAEYEKLGVAPHKELNRQESRYYPFGPVTFHLLGDLRGRVNWAAPNTAYVERDFNARLQGYDDHAAVVQVKDASGGALYPTLKRDFTELVPLVRYRYRPAHEKVREILAREHDVQLTIDIRFQMEAARILEQHIHAAGKERGAAVVIDASTGELLASVSYPGPPAGNAERYSLERDEGNEGSDADSLLDRPRFGLYPPGSAFKLITACAALEARPRAEFEVFECKSLPDGRVGNVVRGWKRPVRDDVLDTSPHGNVSMARGLILSCNAYFAQLGTYVAGAQRLLRTAEHFGIAVASPNTAAILQDALPQASYGQGQVVATPLQMARVAAAIGNGGKFYPTWWDAAQGTAAGKQVLAAEHAELLSGYMRRVVTEGTGQILKNISIPIAGKTGTAELKNQPSHAWFIGFAPYGGQNRRRIAFAVLVENGRYGGRVAAPLAGEIVTAASRLGVID